jgi:hypothetical protein
MLVFLKRSSMTVKIMSSASARYSLSPWSGGI